MTNYDDKVRKLIEEDTVIPAIAQEKWESAMNEIRSGSVKQKKPLGRKILSISIKSVSSLAAAFLILFTVAFVNPVFAEKIPFLANVVGYLKGREDVKLPPVITDTGVESHLEAASQAESAPEAASVPGDNKIQDPSIKISESYCDGNMMVVSLIMNPGVDMKDYDKVNAVLNLKINGQDTSETGENGQTYNNFWATMYKTEDGSFAGIGSMDISGYDLSDSFEIELTTEKLSWTDESTLYWYQALPNDATEFADNGGTNPHFMTEEEVNAYAKTLSTRERLNAGYIQYHKYLEVPQSSTTGTVKVNADLGKTYTPNWTESGCSVNSVVASITSTKLDVVIGENTYLKVTDNNGNELTQLKEARDSTLYTPIIKGATSLTFSFYSMSNEKEVVAQYKMDVDEGYVESDYLPYIPGGWMTDEKVKYIPETLDIPEGYWGYEEGDTLIKFGETLTRTPENYSFLISGKQEVTLSNMKVYENFDDSGFDGGKLYGTDRSEEGYKFVTVDYTLKNTDIVTPFVNEDSGKYEICLDDYISPTSKSAYMDEEYSVTELAYSDKSDGSVHRPNWIQMDSTDEATGTVGFFCKPQIIENKDIVFQYYSAGTTDSVTFMVTE